MHYSSLNSYKDYSTYEYAPLIPQGDFSHHYPSNLRIRLNSTFLTNKWNENTDIIENIRTNLDKYNWYWYETTVNKFLDIQSILKNQDIPWDYSGIVKRPDFELSFVIEYPTAPWCWTTLFCYYDLSVLELFKKYPDKTWNWDDVMRGMHVLLDKDRKWKHLLHLLPDALFSSRALIEKIPLTIVAKYIYKPWNFKTLSTKMYDNHELVIKYPDMDWDWQLLSFMKFDANFIIEHHTKPWDWMRMTNFGNVPWKAVLILPNKPWNKKTLSLSSSLKPIYVVVCPNVFKFKALARNPIITDSFVKRYWKLPWRNKYNHTRRTVAASIIQKWWLDLYYNPYTNVGKRRLMREFNSMVNDI
jgi:hypothetical protein